MEWADDTTLSTSNIISSNGVMNFSLANKTLLYMTSIPAMRKLLGPKTSPTPSARTKLALSLKHVYSRVRTCKQETAIECNISCE
jgi:hypothetical protein